MWMFRHLTREGQPATGLSMKDFEVHDNGRKQTLRSLSHVSGAASPARRTTQQRVQETIYSNRPEVLGGLAVQPAGAQALASSTILLLDESSVGFADLNYARQQVLKFLDRLPESEPVGLYVRTGPSFQILAEQTTDHAALSSVLRKWVPTAQDLARAQEEETRNRQHFDYVDSPSELQYVNGNVGGMNAPTADPLSTAMINYGGNTTPDPKLTKEGQNPQRDALGRRSITAASRPQQNYGQPSRPGARPEEQLNRPQTNNPQHVQPQPMRAQPEPGRQQEYRPAPNSNFANHNAPNRPEPQPRPEMLPQRQPAPQSRPEMQPNRPAAPEPNRPAPQPDHQAQFRPAPQENRPAPPETRPAPQQQNRPAPAPQNHAAPPTDHAAPAHNPPPQGHDDEHHPH